MIDVVDSQTRSRMMSGIKGVDTKPEMLVRRALHARGFRYRLHVKKLPGKPDLVLPKYKVVIFVNGCFWHRHACRLFKWPSTRSEFWKGKLNRNAERDKDNIRELLHIGWRILVIWECALKGRDEELQDEVLEKAENFIIHSAGYEELSG